MLEHHSRLHGIVVRMLLYCRAVVGLDDQDHQMPFAPRIWKLSATDQRYMPHGPNLLVAPIMTAYVIPLNLLVDPSDVLPRLATFFFS